MTEPSVPESVRREAATVLDRIEAEADAGGAYERELLPSMTWADFDALREAVGAADSPERRVVDLSDPWDVFRGILDGRIARPQLYHLVRVYGIDNLREELARKTGSLDIPAVARTRAEWGRSTGHDSKGTSDLLEDIARHIAAAPLPREAQPQSDNTRDLLNSILDWVRGVCPCGSEGPAECPVCGALLDDPSGVCMMYKRGRLPAHLLGRIEQALGIDPRRNEQP